MEYQVTQFDGGFSKNIRDVDRSMCAFTNNFDIHQEAGKLVPQYNTEQDTGADGIKRILAIPSGSDTIYYGLKDNGSGYCELMTKTNITGTWATATNGTGTTNTVVFDMFVYFEPTDSIYWYSTNSGVTELTQYVVGTTTLTERDTVIGTHTTRTDGFINPNDGKLYFATDEELHRIDLAGTVSQDIAPTIPSNYQITSIDSHSVYLAVGCQSKSILGKSVAYLVDVDIASPAPVDVIDFGEGQLKVLGSVSGALVGVVDQARAEFLYDSKMVTRIWTGGDEAEELIDIEGTLVSGSLLTHKAIINNRLYFVANVTSPNRSNNDFEGIWCVGRNSRGKWVLSLDTEDQNLGAGKIIEGFNILGGYRFFCTNDTSDPVRRTNNDGAFETSLGEGSEYVTNKISAHRIGRKLDLTSVSVRTEPLPSAGRVAVYYRRDEDTTWTQIIDNSTDNAVISYAEMDLVGTDENFEEGYEYQFKIESLGGAVITGFYAYFDEQNDGNYD